MQNKLIAAALLLLASPLAGAMRIDGVLDEAEWQTAKTFNDFRIVEPLTRAPGENATELKILPKPDGLYVSMRLQHPPAERTRGRSTRDSQSMDADPAILLIDFEGQGRTAYEFTVSLSGSQRDSIVLNQTDLSTDWDARWIAAVHEDATGWSVEWQIPWSVAPEGAVTQDTRTIGVYAARYLKKRGQRYAFPAIELFGPTFVQSFEKFEVSRYSTASLDWFPYVSAGHDRLDGSSQGRGGLDVTWRPNGSNQMSLAIAPDFGQVESDNLVVNFSAIETFFDDKRPFFTEGQQLFDVRLGGNNRIINTRRVGAAPDAGSEGSTDVLGALKYTGASGRQEYGVFTALEDDSAAAEGRRYAAGRYRWKGDDLVIGYLGSYVERPTLDRRATVHSIDGQYRLRDGISLNGYAIASDIEQPGDRSRGFGSRWQLSVQPGGHWENYTNLTYFDRDLDFDDFGFMDRNDVLRLATDLRYQIRSYPEGHWAQSGNWYLGAAIQRNSSGEALRNDFELGHYWRWRSGGDTYAYVGSEMSGIDDLISRGNGNVRLGARRRAGIEYSSPTTGRFRFYSALRLRQEGESGYTRELQFSPSWFLTETLRVGVQLDYYNGPDWLLWRGADRFASYKRNELDLFATLNWYPRPNQELRAKLQWIGLDAKLRQDLRLGADQRLVPAAAFARDFTLSSLGMQLRYRYEFAPLSELFIVYSRGGDGSLDGGSEGFAGQFQRALDNVTADQLFVKLRYRFS